MADSPQDVRKRLADKRAALADAESAKFVAEQKGADELETAHLLAEEARMDAALAAAKDAADPKNVQAGYASNLDAAKAAMAAYGGKGSGDLPKDGSTLEKPLGIEPDGTVVGLFEDTPVDTVVNPTDEPAPKSARKGASS